MRPTLLELFGVPISSYFFMLSVAMSAGLVMAIHRVRDEGVSVDRFANGCCLALVAGVIGSRIVFVWESWPLYRDHLEEVPMFWRGGLSFFGGLGFALAAGVSYARWHGMPLVRLFDIGVLAVSFGHIFGRSGCWLNGCCYGRPVQGGEWYPFAGPVLDAHIRHPSQAYEVVGLIALFIGLSQLRDRAKPRPGTIVAMYLIGYGSLRFALEPFRDQRGATPAGGLHTYQWAGLIAIGLGLAMLAWTRAAGPSSKSD